MWIKGTCVAVNHQRTFAETSAMLHENTTLNARLCIGRYLWEGKRKAWHVCWLNCDVILEATTSKPITALSAPLNAEGEKVRRVLMWEKDTRVWIIVCRPGQQQALKCYMSEITFLFLPSLRCYLSLCTRGKNDNKRLFNFILLKKCSNWTRHLVLIRGTGVCCERVYLWQGWCYRHQWRAAPQQSWMHNSGSCTLLGSCLYKECPAAGKTHRPGFSWRASVLVGQLTRVNKSQDLLFRWPRSPQVEQEMLGTPGDDAFPVALSKVLW